MQILYAALAVISLVATPAAYSQEAEIDAFTGFRKTGDWELVRANCIACHSAKLITQQRGTAAQWLTMIRWMQAKQNLWQFDPDVEARIIGYLAENYPPSADRRRAAIAPDLMPRNPYAPATNEPAGDPQ
jgi:hypothetical protein